jgi:hypothetical protein
LQFLDLRRFPRNRPTPLYYRLYYRYNSGSKVAPGGYHPPEATPPDTCEAEVAPCPIILAASGGRVKPQDGPRSPIPSFPSLPMPAVPGRRRSAARSTTSDAGAMSSTASWNNCPVTTGGSRPWSCTRPRPTICTPAVPLAPRATA